MERQKTLNYLIVGVQYFILLCLKKTSIRQCAEQIVATYAYHILNFGGKAPIRWAILIILQKKIAI